MAQKELFPLLSIQVYIRHYFQINVLNVAPGTVRSEFQRHFTGFKKWALENILLWDTPYGALTPLYAGTAPEGSQFNGKVCTVVCIFL